MTNAIDKILRLAECEDFKPKSIVVFAHNKGSLPGGLKPAPVSRLREAHPHLMCSCAHFI